MSWITLYRKSKNLLSAIAAFSLAAVLLPNSVSAEQPVTGDRVRESHDQDRPGSRQGVLAGNVTQEAVELVERHVATFVPDAALRFEVASIEFGEDLVQVSLSATLHGLPIAGGGVTVHAEPESYDVRTIAHQLIDVVGINRKPAFDVEQAFAIAAAQPETPFWHHVETAGLTYATDPEGLVRLTWSGRVLWDDHGTNRHGQAFVDAMNGELVRFTVERSDASAVNKMLFTPPQVGTVSLESLNNCGRYIGSFFQVNNADFYEVHFTTFGTPPANSNPIETVDGIPGSVNELCFGFEVQANGRIYVRGCNIASGNCGPYSNGVSVSAGSVLCHLF